VDDSDPFRAEQIARFYVDEFRRLSQQLAISAAGQRRIFLENELGRTKDRLEESEEALKETQQKTGVIHLESQANALIATAARLRARIVATEIQIRGMRAYATDQNAQLQQADEELKGLHEQLAKLAGSDVSDDDLILSRTRLTEAGLEYVRRVQDVKYFEALYESLAGQLEIAKLDEAKRGPIFQIVDPPTPADKRSFPDRGSIVMGAGIAGLLGGISYALCAAGLKHLRSQPQSRARLEWLANLLSLKTGLAMVKPAE